MLNNVFGSNLIYSLLLVHDNLCGVEASQYSLYNAAIFQHSTESFQYRGDSALHPDKPGDDNFGFFMNRAP